MVVGFDFQRVVFDPAKNIANINKHGVSLKYVGDVIEHQVLTVPDTRYDYGEDRYITAGFLEGRLYISIWTLRDEGVRAISLRKANKREVKYYGCE